MSDQTEPAVLVVGAGPTGLTLALELARRGVAVRLVDKSSGPSAQTRALGVQARTLELFERHGTVEDLLSRGLRADRFTVYSEGQPIVRADFSRLPTAHPYLLMIPQDQTEQVLAARLADLGVTVEWRTELTLLDQSEGLAHAELVHASGDRETASFEWVVGADGAHSTVRKALKIDFVGSSFVEAFAVADLRIDWDRPHEEFFAFLDRGRFAAFFPMLDGWHRVAIAQPDPTASTGQVTSDLLQQALADIVPGRAEVSEVRQAGFFRINQRRASTHRQGKVFLAGDAAHIHSVVGAQGMNTGIQDAVNLGWKLAAVLSGSSAPALLDSYAAERAPVAARLVAGTRRVTRLTLLHGALTTTARRLLAPRVTGTTTFQTRLTRAISQLDVSYHSGGPSSPGHRAAAGDRAPDAAVWTSVGPSRLHTLFHPTGFTLLAFGQPLAVLEALEADLQGVAVVTLPVGSAAAQAYQVHEPTLVLIRPDGYIGQRGGAPDIRNWLRHFDTAVPSGTVADARGGE